MNINIVVPVFIIIILYITISLGEVLSINTGTWSRDRKCKNTHQHTRLSKFMYGFLYPAIRIGCYLAEPTKELEK